MMVKQLESFCLLTNDLLSFLVYLRAKQVLNDYSIIVWSRFLVLYRFMDTLITH